MGKYDDLLRMPHHVSDRRPQMSMHDRAAQFSPFAALTGYESVIQETARLTDRRIDLDEGEQEVLDDKLRLISEAVSEGPVVSVTYFRPDTKKEGGAYLTVTGAVKKFKEYEGVLLMADGTGVPFQDILAIDGAMFREMPQ